MEVHMRTNSISIWDLGVKFLPDFDPYVIGVFQLHHLYIGVLTMLIGLAIAAKYHE